MGEGVVRFGSEILFCILLVAFVLAEPVCARPVTRRHRSPLAIDPAETVLWSNTLYLTPPPERDFYEDFIGSGDHRVLEMYDAQWATRSSVNGMQLSQSHYDHNARSSLYAQTRWEVQEQRMRENIANQTFRIRVDESLQNYVTHPDRSPELNKVRRAFESIRDTSVSLSRDSSIRTEMRIGYDIASDASHAEVSVNDVAASIQHPRTTGEVGTDHPFGAAVMSMNVRFAGGTKTASVNYPLHGESITTVYTTPIARGWAGSVSTTQPLRQGVARDSYNVVVSIDF